MKKSKKQAISGYIALAMIAYIYIVEYIHLNYHPL